MAESKVISPSRSGKSTLTQDQIRDIFDFYANFGRTAAMTYQDSVDSFMFMKFVRECPGLLDDHVNRTEVDLIFTKAKPKFERRLDFSHFLDALAAISERKYPDYTPADGLRLLIGNHLTPHWDQLQVEMMKTGETEVPLTGVYKKLYDPNQYTGVYAERFRTGDGRINHEADNRPGRVFTGSTNLGTDEIIHDISVFMRPNLRSGGTMMAPANHTLLKRTPFSPRSISPNAADAAGARRDGRARSASRARSIEPPSFSRSGSTFTSPIRAAGGPTPSHTPAGGFASGSAASSIDPSALSAALARANAGDSSDLIAYAKQLAQAASPAPLRSADARANSSSRNNNDPMSFNKGTTPQRMRSASRGRESSAGSVATHSFSGTVPALTQDQIKEIFDFYANFGRTAAMTYQDSIDSFMFMKFVRECPGLLDDIVNRTEVDLIFTKAKPKFERRLHFSHFLDALAAIAERKYPDYTPADGLRLLIGNHLTPHWDFVQMEMLKTGETEVPLTGVYKKLYDPNQYTGVYAERFRTGDGRINHEADNRPGRSFTGSTNLGTDEIIHDISVFMRPNLRSGSMRTTRDVLSGGSPTRALSAARSSSPSRSASRGRSIMSPDGGRSVSTRL